MKMPRLVERQISVNQQEFISEAFWLSQRTQESSKAFRMPCDSEVIICRRMGQDQLLMDRNPHFLVLRVLDKWKVVSFVALLTR